MQIETDRLLIHPISLKEAHNVAALVTEKISLWTGPIPWPYSINDAEYWIKNTEPTKHLGIYLLPEQVLIGTTSMPSTNGDEVGFWINGQYEGKGYATEAVAAIMDYAFTNIKLDFLDSGVHRDNIGSRRVHEKLGFSVIAEENRQWRNKTAPVPVLVYRLRRSK